MSALLVGYDLYRGDQKDYKSLFKFLESEGQTWHDLDSTWIVVTSKTPTELTTEIMKHVHSKDKVLVFEVTNKPAAWTPTFGQGTTDWINQYT